MTTFSHHFTLLLQPGMVQPMGMVPVSGCRSFLRKAMVRFSLLPSSRFLYFAFLAP